jgi:hypothetical protein
MCVVHSGWNGTIFFFYFWYIIVSRCLFNDLMSFELLITQVEYLNLFFFHNKNYSDSKRKTTSKESNLLVQWMVHM